MDYIKTAILIADKIIKVIKKEILGNNSEKKNGKNTK